MRLIDADAYLKKVCTYNETGCGSCRLQAKCPVDEPTVDAVPVRHAKWIPKITKIGEIDWPSGMMCSGCGEDALNAEGTDFLTDFCPHCGARMDEVEHETD